MLKPYFRFLAVFSGLISLALAGGAPDYSKEAAVIQSMATQVSFGSDGSREWHQTTSIRVQSEAALREYGVLSFFYQADSETTKVDYVRVKKADGTVVETPTDSIQDVSTNVTAAAPTYSDVRQKQIPVKSLGIGDVLEYSLHSWQKKPEVPGQFWYDQGFVDKQVMLSQTLEVRIPKTKQAQVFSPKLLFTTRDEGDQRLYTWTHSHLEPSKVEEEKDKAAEPEPLLVRITSFRNWEAVGDWWSALATSEIAVTPAIESKAKELTAGLTTDAAKERALYRFVSMKFRYISISLGAGRYRPHAAAEVLVNQYGDCKDKHTLFVALLKAVGIPAWPALLGVGMKFEAAVPSPGQFNHVITVIPQGGKYVWLDTTAEVAPFGLLRTSVRDQQALVIPANSKPLLIKTPLEPPFPVATKLDVKSSLASDGTLTGHFDFQMEGEVAVELRGAFRTVPPMQWQALVQQFSRVLGFSGDVSAVEVENLEDTEKPLHYSYEYKREKYADWENLRIIMPLPPEGFGPGGEAEKPKEPFWAGDPGSVVYRATLKLPPGYTTEVPKGENLTSGFADYSSQYSLHDSTLTGERKLSLKKSKIALEQWNEYQKLSKSIQTDYATYLVLQERGAKPPPTDSQNESQEASQLLDRAADAIQRNEMNEAADLLSQAERLNPKQYRLWGLRSVVEIRAGKREEAIADGCKEIEYHPGELAAYQSLGGMLVYLKRRDEAIEVWKRASAVMSENDVVANYLATLLMQARRWNEVPPILEKPIAAAPDKHYLKTMRVEAYLRGGLKEQGLAEALALAKVTSAPEIRNDLAYQLAEVDFALDQAETWSRESIKETEEQCKISGLGALSSADLSTVSRLASQWDTLGWIFFKQNKLSEAKKYLDAAWQLGQSAAVADHLGQLYEKQGKRSAAVHMWRLAVASNFGYEPAEEHLRLAGATLEMPSSAKQGSKDGVSVAPQHELGVLRTVKVPELPALTGTAEYFVLLSGKGVEDVRLINGSKPIKDGTAAIRQANFDFSPPDNGPEKIVRRGILSCSTYTKPSCQFTLLLPSTTNFSPMAELAVKETGNVVSDEVVQPALISKVEPDYTPGALKARLEGTVALSIQVDPEGMPTQISVVTPLGLGLDENAKDCVSKWRFKPATKNGKPVAVVTNVEVNFRMGRTVQ